MGGGIATKQRKHRASARLLHFEVGITFDLYSISRETYNKNKFEPPPDVEQRVDVATSYSLSLTSWLKKIPKTENHISYLTVD